MGYPVQTAFPHILNYEVPVWFSNRDVFGKRERRTRMLTPEVESWLDQYGGDWSVIHWEQEIAMRGEFEPYTRNERVGRIFQFESRWSAVMFRLCWNCFKRGQRSIEEDTSD